MKTPTDPAILKEDDVVAAVCRLLEAHGYVIRRRATTVQRGYDIVAEGPTGDLIVEAKGEGSSRFGSARFGHSFNSRQVRSHVGNALLKALRVVSGGEARAAIALPDTPHHRKEVSQVQDAISALAVGVFWVSPSGPRADLEAPWEL